MKSNPLRTFFEWALITSVLMSVGFCVFYLLKTRAERACDTQVANAQAHFNGNRAFTQALVGDCQEYAKTNADLTRFLNSLNQPSAGPVATGKSGAR